MKNQVLNSVKIATSKRSKNRFNLAHDVNTTFSWGDTQPLHCRMMYPGDKNILDISSLVRCAPLVRPTFGRIKYKTWSQFVSMLDIMPEFGSLVSQSGSYQNGVFETPASVPSLPLGFLSTAVLIGAKFTAYSDVNSDRSTARSWKVSNISASTPSSAQNLITDVLYATGWTGSNTLGRFHFTGPAVNITQILKSLNADTGSSFGSVLASHLGVNITDIQSIMIPSGNKAQNTFLLYSGDRTQYQNYPLTNVALDKSDVVLPLKSSSSSRNFWLAGRLSAFGSRLYKILTGLGWKFNLENAGEISILRLFAYYKAYWDVFGLTRFKSWKETNCYKLIDMIRSRRLYGKNFAKAVLCGAGSGGDSEVRGTFFEFLVDLGNCWVTEDVDFVSAHTANINNTAVDGSFASDGGRWLDTSSLTDNATIIGGSTDANTPSSLPSVDTSIKTYLSGLSIDALQRLYRWTNKMSVAGREIADILKAQGYGYYVYSCKSNFIGYNETSIQITDVTSTADTFKDGSGAILADYAGKGVQYDESKTMEFETDEFGYWITIASIVPEAGYSQGFDSDLFCLDKYDLFNGEFDSLGYEARRKLEIVGENLWPSAVLPYFSTFGFGPRYFGIKSVRNICNGEFSLGHKKDDLLPYELDRHIPLGEHYVGTVHDDTTYSEFEVIPMMTDIPVAGDEWRYVSRYPWLGYFERIFANTNSDDLRERLLAVQEYGDDSDSLSLIIEVEDNFLSHNVMNLQSWRNMLPVDESFGTGAGDEFNSGFDSSVSKA